MKRLLLCLILGCSSSDLVDQSGQSPNSSDSNEPYAGSGGSDGNGCNALVQIVQADVPDAGMFVIKLPIPCNMNYIDKGDPPYEKKFYAIGPADDTRKLNPLFVPKTD